MAKESAQERTERATPKRLQEAKQRGQVPRSRELNTSLMLLTSAIALYALGEGLGVGLLNVLRQGLSLEPWQIHEPQALVNTLGSRLADALLLFAPFFLVMVAVALIAPVLLGGWLFSAKPMSFNWGKLNPVQGLGRIFSLQGLIELIKALAKFALVSTAAIVFLWTTKDEIGRLADAPVEVELAHAFHLFGRAFLVFSAATILIASADVPYQLWEHGRKLRMTRQELKDELKETEGRPEVKGRIRNLQRDMAQRRMMEEIPSADVVVTNPTHFAVALRYDALHASAPRVVAKGADLMAGQVRLIATAHEVPVVEIPPLARALYYSVDLDQEIPTSLYLAVAHVLAYVYQLRTARESGAPEPPPPSDLPVPEDLLRQ